MSPSRLPDYYALLEVPPDAPPETIRAAHKRLIKAWHPDVNPEADPRRVMLLNAAFEVLSDPQRRAAYDIERRTGPAPRKAPAAPSAAPKVKVREAQWPGGFDPVEQERHQARVEARYRVAAEKRAAEAAAKAHAEEAERERKREQLRQDRQAAREKLKSHRAELERKAADEAAKAEVARKAEQAKAIAAQLESQRSTRLKQRTRLNQRAVPDSFAPMARFKAKLWQALSDPELIYSGRQLHPVARGTWEVQPEGIHWKPENGTPQFIPASEIDWAARKLWSDGYLSRIAVTQRMQHPDKFGRDGERLGKTLFTLLTRLPFFEIRREPLAVEFNRSFWEPLVE